MTRRRPTLFASLRLLSGPVAWALLLAWLVPVLAGALPSPVSAAERALYEDSQASLCLQGMPGDQTTDHDRDACCVLCTAPALPSVAEGIDPLSATLLVPATGAQDFAAIADVTRAMLAAIISPITGRGPPA